MQKRFGRLRPVVEDVPEMAAARRTEHLHPRHAVAQVEPGLDCIELGGLDEARPARARVVLRVGTEQLAAAAGAPVDACLLGVPVRPAERPLGAVLTQNRVLLGRQPFAPLLVAELDLPLGHYITTSETATNCVTAAATTSRWKTSWKPSTRGNGSGHFAAYTSAPTV